MHDRTLLLEPSAASSNLAATLSGQFDDLHSYVEGSFAVYARHQRAQLMAPRMTQWEADPDVGKLFDFHAADGLTRKYARG